MIQKQFAFSFSAAIFAMSTASLAVPQPLLRWGLVYGSDKTLSEAMPEINRFNGSSVQLTEYQSKAALFMRSKRYRSVLLFSTEKEANSAQPVVESYLTKQDIQNFRVDSSWVRGSYVVNLSSWCPKWNSRMQAQSQGAAQSQVLLPYYICKI